MDVYIRQFQTNWNHPSTQISVVKQYRFLCVHASQKNKLISQTCKRLAKKMTEAFPQLFLRTDLILSLLEITELLTISCERTFGEEVSFIFYFYI
jgi:hypothetical protein